ncbi:MAG: hypothetical protein U9N86_08865, partial [Bacteroidota bacterium]|nr:hypothetical protein [Bacteroidota bacterium]
MKEVLPARNYQHLKSVLSSLEDSTDCSVSLRGETVNFWSRNAAPKNQGVSMTFGHGVPGLAIIDNGKFRILCVGNGTKFAIESDSVQVEIPARYLKRLFEFPASAPAWVSGIVTVGWANEFSGFRPVSGRPTFNHYGNIVIEYWGQAGKQKQVFPFGEPTNSGFEAG